MSTASAHRPALAAARRVVVKLGTRVLTHDDGRIALARLFATVESVARAWDDGRQVIVVSSGAVGLGRTALGLAESPTDLALRQACAAAGQVRLMGLWESGFSRLSRPCAQVLLTQSDFDHRRRYLELRQAMEALLAHGAVPVVNENDVVSTAELAFVDGADHPVFGDNDRLSALVAAKLDAELLVLLTDVPGVYDRDPRMDPDARLLSELGPTEDVDAGGARSAASRGGMRSKVDAARVAALAGCHAVIADGRDVGTLDAVLAGDAVGTWVHAAPGLSARKRWVAFATAPRGLLHLDAGAVRAVCERGASLLAIGVTRVEGDFAAGDVVLLLGPDGAEIGRGAVHVDADAARAWASGATPPEVRRHHALVHRNQLVVLAPETP
ncbi:MAG: glutamate 5-kinase [Alphaproteobacteria bacterium]|nr:glutamate 5-kinase [Alphaproteobacteria bacterium]